MKSKAIKRCNGTGKAVGYGCGEIKQAHKYGICFDCFKLWLQTPAGFEIIKNTISKAREKVAKESRPKNVKWDDKPLKEMIQYVQENIVNPYIRFRDESKYNRCISSNNYVSDAGHYYSVGSNCQLRFNIMNIHGQGASDNRHKGGNLIAYKEGLTNRHGEKYFKRLERLKLESHKWPKLDRIELIKIGKTYKHLHKNKMLVFDHEEFENYKFIICK